MKKIFIIIVAVSFIVFISNYSYEMSIERRFPTQKNEIEVHELNEMIMPYIESGAIALQDNTDVSEYLEIKNFAEKENFQKVTAEKAAEFGDEYEGFKMPGECTYYRNEKYLILKIQDENSLCCAYVKGADYGYSFWDIKALEKEGKLEGMGDTELFNVYDYETFTGKAQEKTVYKQFTISKKTGELACIGEKYIFENGEKTVNVLYDENGKLVSVAYSSNSEGTAYFDSEYNDLDSENYTLLCSTVYEKAKTEKNIMLNNAALINGYVFPD